MAHLKFIRSKEKKKILSQLEELYGITSLPYQLLETGKKKIRAFSGSLTQDEMKTLSQIANIEIIGMYLISQKDNDPRINFDAIPLLKSQMSKSIYEISDSQFQEWIRGHDLKVKAPRGALVIKYNSDLIGVAKSNGEKIFNYTPKERTIRTPLKN